MAANMINNFNLDAALYGLYQKHNRSGLQVITFIPQSARDTFDPSVAPFVPEAMREVLNPVAAPFVRRAARVAVNADTEAVSNTSQSIPSTPNSQSSALVLLFQSTLDAHAKISVPESRAEQEVLTPASSSNALFQKPLCTPSLSSAPETSTDLSNESRSDSGEIDTSSVDVSFGYDFQIQSEAIHGVNAELKLVQEESRASQTLTDMSLVRYVDPIGLARAGLALPRKPILNDFTVSIPPLVVHMPIDTLHSSPTADAFALHRAKVLPALPLLSAFLIQLKTLALVAARPAMAVKFRGRVAHPWELGYGPSFKQAVADTLDDLRASSSSTQATVQPSLPNPYSHHWSYLGDAVMHKHDTDPAISCAVILGKPKGAMSDCSIGTKLHIYTLLWQAFLLVDPVIVCGSISKFLNLSVSQIRDAAVGRVWRYLRLGGTWSVDDYPGELVYGDRNISHFLPSVFIEINDFGYSRYPLFNDTSFRQQIEIAYSKETAEDNRRYNKSKKAELIGFSRCRSWSPPGSSPLRQVHLIGELPSFTFANLKEIMQPTTRVWADLEDDEEDLVWNRRIGQINLKHKKAESNHYLAENEGMPESSSFESQILMEDNEQSLAVMDDSSSVYSSDDENICVPISNLFDLNTPQIDRLTRAEQMDLLRERGAANPFADVGEVSVEELDGEPSDDEEDMVAADEDMSPIYLRRARRSVSIPLPEAEEVLRRSLSSRAVSAPSRLFSGFTLVLAYRPKANLPRSSGLLNLRDIPAHAFSRRPEANLSPIMMASIAEDDEEDVNDADVEDNEEEEKLSISDINQAYREFHGIAEPSLLSLHEEFGAVSTEFIYKTPTTLARYRHRQSNIDLLPTIVSSPDHTDEERAIIDGISYTPPSSAPKHGNKVEEESSSESSSISGDAVIGSSPPFTPTKAGPLINFETPPRIAGSNLLDGISVSPISFITSPIEQPTLSFSAMITVAVTEDYTPGEDITDPADDEDTDLLAEFQIFLPPNMIQVPEAPTPSVDETQAYGQVIISDHPQVKKTWRLNKLRSILLNSKEQRNVLLKKHGRKVSGATMLSAADATTKKKGFWGSVKSRMSSMVRRQ